MLLFWLLSFKSTSTLSGSNIFVRSVQSDTRTPNLSTVYHPFVNVPDNSLYSNTSHSQDALTNYYWTLDDVGVKPIFWSVHLGFFKHRR